MDRPSEICSEPVKRQDGNRQKVIEMAQSMRLIGAILNYNLVIAIAKGILLANDRTLFAENVGSIGLGWKCCTSV